MKREEIYYELRQLLNQFGNSQLLTIQINNKLLMAIQNMLCQDQDKLHRRNMQIKELKGKLEECLKIKTPILPSNPTQKEMVQMAIETIQGKRHTPYKLTYNKDKKTIVAIAERDMLTTKAKELEQSYNALKGVYEGLKASNDLNRISLNEYRENCKKVLDIINPYSHIPAQFKACQILQDILNR